MSYFKKSSQEVNVVYKTNDLSVFQEIKGNRPPNPQHIRRLVASIKENGLLCNPILVNERLEVIDGQHRLLAAKESKSEIYYIVLNGYDLKEVHALNLNQKNWTKKDFMDGYAEMGVEPYIKLRNFMRKNKVFNITDCIALCSNTVSGSTADISQKYRKGLNNINIKEVFEEGTWQGKDFEIAQQNADKLRMIKPYYDGYRRSTFIGTMLGLFKNKNFDFFDFLNKLKMQTQKMEDCTSVSQYKLLIEDIYNYRRREKVSLRY
tara:strand:+ start:548 stop:1336 length:789 start_codon:yes stop_codon:yes gene_type:complete